jgi:hypothetical protein
MAAPTFEVFFSEFKEKACQTFKNNWNTAYYFYFEAKVSGKPEDYYQPDPFPLVKDEAPFDAALKEGIYDEFVTSLSKAREQYLPPAFHSERALIIKICAYQPKMTHIVSKEIWNDISFWHEAVAVSGRAIFGVHRGCISDGKQLRKTLFSDQKFTRKTLQALPHSERKCFIERLQPSEFSARDQVLEFITQESQLIEALDTYIKQLETDALYYQCTHAFWGGYNKASRLSVAKELHACLVNVEGKPQLKAPADWCNDALRHSKLGPILAEWERAHDEREYAYGGLLIAAVNAVVLALVPLTLVPQVVVAVLGALIFAVSAYMLYHSGEIQDAIPSALVPCT